MTLKIQINGAPLELELPDGADVEVADGKISVKVAEKRAPLPWYPIYPQPTVPWYPYNQPIITWGTQTVTDNSDRVIGINSLNSEAVIDNLARYM